MAQIETLEPKRGHRIGADDREGLIERPQAEAKTKFVYHVRLDGAVVGHDKVLAVQAVIGGGQDAVRRLGRDGLPTPTGEDVLLRVDQVIAANVIPVGGGRQWKKPPVGSY